MSRQLRVVLASPSDVQEERNLVPRVIEEINEGVAEDRNLHLSLLRWETDAYPGFHPDGPQGLIDSLLGIEHSDILIGIFWWRMGTPVHDAPSGTVHEINKAIEAWREKGRPHIMIYFCQRAYTPKTSKEANQWAEVLRYKESFPQEGLYWQYNDAGEFEKELRGHLRRIVKQYPIPGLTGTASSSADTSFRGRVVLHLISREPVPEDIDDSTTGDLLETVESIRRRALEAHDRGEYDNAIQHWSSFLSLVPENPVPYYNRANTYFAMERHDDAVADYTAAIKLGLEHAYPYNNRGIVYGKLGRYDESLADLNKAIELEPTLAEAHHNRGITFQRAGDYAEALINYDRAIGIKPDYIDAFLNRGRIHGWTKRYEEALADFGEVIRLAPDAAEPYWHRGTTYIYLERYKEAIDDFNEALKLKPGYAEVYCNRGVAYERRNKIDQALADYTTAIEFKPDYVDAYRNRGIFQTGLGRFEEALADFDKAIELKPDYADTHNSRGVAYAKLERLEEALNNFNRAVELDPSFAEAHSNRGGIHAMLENLPKAIAAFDAAIEHNPDFRGAYINRGRAHYDLGNHKKALEDFSKVIDLNPRSQEAFSIRGNTLLKLQRYEEAQQDLERAIELDPDHTRDYLALAEAFLFTHSFDRALSVAGRAELQSDDPRDRILSRYYKCLALRLAGQETHEVDAQLEELMQEPVHLGWSFQEIRTWMGSADLDPQTRDYIEQLTDRLESLGP